MAVNMRNRADFAETFVVHAALKHALARKLFGGDVRAQNTAAALIKSLEGERSIYGRQLKMIGLMTKGGVDSADRQNPALLAADGVPLSGPSGRGRRRGRTRQRAIQSPGRRAQAGEAVGASPVVAAGADGRCGVPSA